MITPAARLGFAAALLTLTSAAPSAPPADLIPREVFFGNPSRAAVRVSPGGDRLSFLAAHQGVLNVWVQSIDGDDPRPVTAAAERPIRTYFWMPNNEQIVYAQDRGGDENFRLFAVNVDTGEEVDLTPFDAVQARVTALDREFPDELLVAVNNRMPQLHDVWRVNTRTGEGEMIFENTGGFIGIDADSRFQVRIAARMDPATGRVDVFTRDSEDGEWYELVRWAMEDNQTSSVLGFSRDGGSIFLVDSRNTNTGELYRYDLGGDEGPSYEHIAGHDRADVADVIFDPSTGRPQAVAFEYARREWTILDPSIRADFRVLEATSEGELSITSRDLADRLWTVAYLRDDGPVTYYLYDRQQRRARYLFSNRPELEGLPLAPMRPVVITARDGLPLVSYLTVPVVGASTAPLGDLDRLMDAERRSLDGGADAGDDIETIDIDELSEPEVRFGAWDEDEPDRGPRHKKFRQPKKQMKPDAKPASTPSEPAAPPRPAASEAPLGPPARPSADEGAMVPIRSGGDADAPADDGEMIPLRRRDLTPAPPPRAAPPTRPAPVSEAAGGPPWPMVLLVHGGPWARDSWGYNALHQWLANRGYAVLSVNFRGSTGFGKDFVNAGDREWAGRMHDDLIDAVNWAVGEGIADPDRVAIMGGSYGGYAALVGLTFTPDFFAAGVDIVGPSHIRTLLESIPPYWKPVQALFEGRVGRLSEGDYLDQISPLTRVDRIRRPLLIGQGANDPRVKEAESQQIVAAMQAKDLPVTYVVFPDEGHGFARPANNLAFFAITEAFLAQHLGGRYEPIGSAVRGSSADVQAGAELVPGVSDAAP